MSAMTQTCIACRAELPIGEFYKRTPQRQRRSSRCRSCMANYHRDRLAAETPEQRADRLRKGRENWFRAKYGISLADYERMYAEQRRMCASCGNPPTGKGCAATLNVDHDHDTKEVRGLLCNPCNQALGLLRDDPDVIWGLLIYARRHQKPKLRLVA
jgi:hypothetical protein